MKIVSKSAKETQTAAAKLAKKILIKKRFADHAVAIALSGNLGAGKTTFVQGLAKALGIKRRVTSPTFILFRKHKLPKRRFYLYHFDLYRIRKIKELETIGFQKILTEPSNIVLIEWSEKVKRVLPRDTIWVELSYGRKETERIIAYRR